MTHIRHRIYEKHVFWAKYAQFWPIFAPEDTFRVKFRKIVFIERSTEFFCIFWYILICTHMAHIFKNMCHMGANQNIPKNAEKFCGSFYKDDFSEFYPESVFRSENGSKLSIFGPKYVFFVNSVPDVCQIIKILKIFLLMLPMRIFCYLWNFRTTLR